jgi:hypothetical protein
MAVTDPFSITYGSRQVGGSSASYRLHGPYLFDKTFEGIRATFTVIVVGTSIADLQSKSDDLENDFSKRDQDLVIDLDGSSFTYTFGVDLMNSSASASKSGDAETDRGLSRAYTCVVEGGLPAGDQNGLRELEVNVDYEPGRQIIASMQGVYTLLSGVSASAQYQSDFDSEASTILSGIDASATFELVDESFTRDRNDHTCSFNRQYQQLLANQSTGSLDDANITDHSIIFTTLFQFPANGQPSIHPIKRAIGKYDCAIDIDNTTDLQATFSGKVRPLILQLFQDNYSPQVFGIEDETVGYDETTKRLSASVTFQYQSAGGSDILSVSQNLAIKESQQIDYTYLHDEDVLGAIADVGFGVLLRIAQRTVIAIGEEPPRRRIFPEAGAVPGKGKGGKNKGGAQAGSSIGEIDGIEGTAELVDEGWNIIDNTSQVTPQWIGDPNETQLQQFTLTESVVERFTKRPESRAPITFGGS